MLRVQYVNSHKTGRKGSLIKIAKWISHLNNNWSLRYFFIMASAIKETVCKSQIADFGTPRFLYNLDMFITCVI